MLSVEHLTKTFGRTKAVNDISFTVNQGESFGLLGPNGAGKSTTISMIAGLLPVDTGIIRLNDIGLKTNPTEFKRHIGLVPQNIALYTYLSAEENLRFWGQLYGLRGAKLKERVKWCIELAGLEHHRNKQVRHYSGGMQRRLNIAASMIHEPSILIMDEPTVGVDPQSRNHILETVKRLNQAGTTIIYTSHYMEEVQFLCDRVAIVDHGELIAYGSLSEVTKIAGSKSTVYIVANGSVTSFADEIRQLLPECDVAVDDAQIVVNTSDTGHVLSCIVQKLMEHRLQIANVKIAEPNLENVFLHLTGRALRDGQDAQTDAEVTTGTSSQNRGVTSK